MVERLQVDSDAIHALAQHIRAVSVALSDARPAPPTDEVFESTVVVDVRAAAAELRRQLAALHDLTSALALAGDRAAEELISRDTGLAGSIRQ